MRLTSQDRQAYLQIEYSGEAQKGSPQLPVRVQAAGYGFEGRHPALWLSRAELDAFLRELQRLDTTRRGGAQLTSMSHGEFVLELRSMESTGRVLASVSIDSCTSHSL